MVLSNIFISFISGHREQHEPEDGMAVQYNYGSLIGMGFRFYDAERVGALPANFTIPWRGPSLLQVRPALSSSLLVLLLSACACHVMPVSVPQRFSQFVWERKQLFGEVPGKVAFGLRLAWCCRRRDPPTWALAT